MTNPLESIKLPLPNQEEKKQMSRVLKKQR